MRALQHFRKRLRTRHGQATTEYLLVVSVLVIAIVAVAYDPMRVAAQGGSRGFQKKLEPATAKGNFGEPGKER